MAAIDLTTELKDFYLRLTEFMGVSIYVRSVLEEPRDIKRLALCERERERELTFTLNKGPFLSDTEGNRRRRCSLPLVI